MADESRFEGMDFEVKVGGRSSSDTPASDVPFRILVLGDFSGRSNRGLRPSGDSSSSRRPVLVDRDNIDEIIAKLNVEVHVPIGVEAAKVKITFGELDDFHPDRLYEHRRPTVASPRVPSTRCRVVAVLWPEATALSTHGRPLAAALHAKAHRATAAGE